MHCHELGEWKNPTALVIAANIRRRHLSATEIARAVAKLVVAQPEKSDRQIAKNAGVSHKTVARARRKAEATGQCPQLEKRVGAAGKARKRPRKAAGDDGESREEACPTRVMVGKRKATPEEEDQIFGALALMRNPIASAWEKASAEQRLGFVEAFWSDLS